MINLGNIERMWFVGIGGIGMSALARYFHSVGLQVGGYDKTATPLTKSLQNEGIEVIFSEEVHALPARFSQIDEDLLVVVTPAVPAAHRQLAHMRQQGAQLVKRSELLGAISNCYKTLCVAGTHGKTTTSTLLAHLLHANSIPVHAFLGGISSNYGSNLVVSADPATFMVTEADEYDRSFLQLHPFGAAITSTEPDHLDIYGHAEAMLSSYTDFALRVPAEGFLLLHQSVELIHPPKAKTYTYGAHAGCTFQAEDIRVEAGAFVSTFRGPGMNMPEVVIPLPGRHNVENALCAAAMAHLAGVSEAGIRSALLTFTGVKRRFERICSTSQVDFIDDYAHHPSELRATITAARELWPNKSLTGIFQPHLYSRTRDFMAGFAEALSQLDTCALLDIYPAREEPIPGITSAELLSRMTTRTKILLQRTEVLPWLAAHKPDVLLTLGAGDIDALVPTIKTALCHGSEN